MGVLTLSDKNTSSTAATTRTGALVIGGSFQSLGIIRSLGVHGVPVYVIDRDWCIARFSRYTRRTFTCPPVTEELDFLDFLQTLARKENLRQWVIYPNDDQTISFLSRHKKELAEFYRTPVPDWEVTRFAYDKRLTYQLAKKTGIPIPGTFYPRSVDDLQKLDIEFPAIIKPAIRDNFYEKARKKAIRVNNRTQLVEQYLEVAAIIDSAEIMVQELIPGRADNLYSFGSLYKDGRVLGKVIARRVRQHPAEFGRVTTYAETVDIPELEELAKRFLDAMGYNGISEIEFMQDPRDKVYKLIEMNARFWAWHSLAIAAGVDFPYLLYQDMLGNSVPVNGFEKGVKWFRLILDVPINAVQIAKGRMSPGTYLKSWKGKKTFSVLSLRDPLPFLAEILLVPYIWKKRGI